MARRKTSRRPRRRNPRTLSASNFVSSGLASEFVQSGSLLSQVEAPGSQTFDTGQRYVPEFETSLDTSGGGKSIEEPSWEPSYYQEPAPTQQIQESTRFRGGGGGSARQVGGSTYSVRGKEMKQLIDPQLWRLADGGDRWAMNELQRRGPAHYRPARPNPGTAWSATRHKKGRAGKMPQWIVAGDPKGDGELRYIVTAKTAKAAIGQVEEELRIEDVWEARRFRPRSNPPHRPTKAYRAAVTRYRLSLIDKSTDQLVQAYLDAGRAGRRGGWVEGTERLGASVVRAAIEAEAASRGKAELKRVRAAGSPSLSLGSEWLKTPRRNPAEYGSLKRSRAARKTTPLSEATLKRIRKKALDASNTATSVDRLEKRVMAWAKKEFPGVRKTTLANAVSDAVESLWRMNPRKKSQARNNGGSARKAVQRRGAHTLGSFQHEGQKFNVFADYKGRGYFVVPEGSSMYGLITGRPKNPGQPYGSPITAPAGRRYVKAKLLAGDYEAYGVFPDGKTEHVKGPILLASPTARSNPRGQRDMTMLIGEDGNEFAQWDQERRGIYHRNLTRHGRANPGGMSPKVHREMTSPAAERRLIYLEGDEDEEEETPRRRRTRRIPKTKRRRDSYSAAEDQDAKDFFFKRNPDPRYEYQQLKAHQGKLKAYVKVHPRDRAAKQALKRLHTDLEVLQGQMLMSRASLNPSLASYVGGGRGLTMRDLVQDRHHGSGSRGGYTQDERDDLPDSEFLKPEVRGWPVSDETHAKEAIKYMVRGFGNTSEYPTLIMRLSQHWPVNKANKSIWALYTRSRSKIARKCGCSMPSLKDMARYNTGGWR